MRPLPTRAGNLDFSQGPLLMGILNVTPDSFSDGGKFLSPEMAIAQAETMVEEGASLLDIGGESTRPGATPVSVEEEIARVIPLVELLAQRLPRIPLSIDTTKAEVARQALEEGASLINDISALRDDSEMVKVLKEHQVSVILMHRQGTPQTMQANPNYRDVTQEVFTFLQERLEWALGQGLVLPNILLDPGIGFGKTTEHNIDLLKNLKVFHALNCPLVLGTSRKSFLGKLLSSETDPVPVSERNEASLATHLWAADQGVQILRVHDVGHTARGLKIWRKLKESDVT